MPRARNISTTRSSGAVSVIWIGDWREGEKMERERDEGNKESKRIRGAGGEEGEGGGREGGKEGGSEGGNEGGREGMREGGREGGRESVRERRGE